MARVLVVDDEAVIRQLVRLSLEQDGHVVTEASDGVEALEAVGRQAPDVMVLDLTMPHLGGPLEGPAPRSTSRRFGVEQVRALSARQSELLRAVAATPTVLAAAEGLGVSRSNVYASLRRIAHRLSVPTVPELVVQARLGWGDDGS